MAILWRWGFRNVLEGYRCFGRKWGIDITEHGYFKEVLKNYSDQIGYLQRRIHSKWALSADRLLNVLAWRAGILGRLWKRFWFRLWAKRVEYAEWPDYPR